MTNFANELHALIDTWMFDRGSEPNSMIADLYNAVAGIRDCQESEEALLLRRERRMLYANTGQAGERTAEGGGEGVA